MAAPEADALNDNQRRHFLSSCQYVDRLLTEMEAILASSESGSPFNRFVADVPPAQKRVVLDFIARIRRELVRALESEGLQPDAPSTRAAHALRTHLSFIDVALEELKPSYMEGYGEVSVAAADRLTGLVAELQATVGKLDAQLARTGVDVLARFSRLEALGVDLAVVRTLHDVVERQGLTEFQPALNVLLDRLEERHFEIAVFGRVSTGKSSLLNHLLHTDVLPVGVNPITAIPTRLTYGTPPRVVVDFLTGARETVPLEQLPAFVSEEHNPGNTKRVSRLVAFVASERLADGILFVDTPGLGSLATSGAAETLAYLPRCDLGLVLIDAASTLTPEDVGTLRALLDAGVEVMVLLSKADLADAGAITRITSYIQRRLREELGAELDIFPVSTTTAFAEALERWYADHVLPRIAQHDELRRRSLARKTGALLESVTLTLERLAARKGPAAVPGASDAALRAAAKGFEDARVEGEEALLAIPQAWRVVLRHAAERLSEDATARADGSAAAGVVRSVLEETMAVASVPLLDRLKRLVTEARTALGDAGHLADLDERQFLREVPRPDLAALDVHIKVGAIRLFGATATRSAIERALVEQVGTDLQGTTGAYGALLRRWYLRTLGDIRHAFELAADAWRAQHRSVRADGPASDSIAADFRMLSSLSEPSRELPGRRARHG